MKGMVRMDEHNLILVQVLKNDRWIFFLKFGDQLLHKTFLSTLDGLMEVKAVIEVKSGERHRAG